MEIAPLVLMGLRLNGSLLLYERTPNVPVMLLARLAVQKDWKKKGVGRGLLRNAVLRTVQAADIAGIRALAVHAKDEQARRYYEQFDFAASPADPLHLLVLLKDIRRRFGA